MPYLQEKRWDFVANTHLHHGNEDLNWLVLSEQATEEIRDDEEVIKAMFCARKSGTETTLVKKGLKRVNDAFLLRCFLSLLFVQVQ